jgi:hypothetical protein
MEKIWKDIPWYEWYYQVNKLGEIKSLPKRRGCVILKERILKLQKDKDWYLAITLYIKWNKKYLRVHRLVLLAFVWSSNWLQCNHINWIKDDNRIENLEWCTISENAIHKFHVLWYKNNFHTNHQYSKDS